MAVELTYLTPTPAATVLHDTVGNSIVGFGSSCWYPPALGILPDVNAMFGVHEFDTYDPLTPQSLFTSWSSRRGSSLGRTECSPTSCRSRCSVR